MKNRPTIEIVVFLLACLLPQISVSQSILKDSVSYQSAAEDIFEIGIDNFKRKKFEFAVEAFLQVITQHPKSHRISAVYVMAGKAYYELEQHRDAVKILKQFIDLYPGSRYEDDALYTLGLCYGELGRYDDAAMSFLRSYESSTDRVLKGRSEKLLEGLVLPFLEAGELQLLQEWVKAPDMSALVTVRLAEKLYRKGELREAQQLLRSISRLSIQSKYVSDAKSLLERIERGEIIKIGAVLPLMYNASHSSARELGTSLLAGMNMAIEEHNETSFPRIELEVRDSEKDPGIAGKRVRELCEDNRVVAVVGPFFSNEAFASAGIADAMNVPLITPTATSTGIAGLGNHIFQLNPDYEVRGRAMARYAIEQLQAKSFAILAPAGGNFSGKIMSDAFVDEVEKSGGTMVDIQWYQAGDTDLKTQLMAIRQKGLERSEDLYVDFSKKMSYNNLLSMLRWGVPPRFLDSLVERGAKISVNLLFGMNGRVIADSLKIPHERTRFKVDSLAIPINTIDAMFVPISQPDEIGIVASQLKYFNIQTLILGTGDWNDLVELDRHRQYVDGVIFSSDYFLDDQNPDVTSFYRRYMKRTNREPDMNTLFAYDAVKYVLEGIKVGGTHRIALARILSASRTFEGIHSRVSLGDNRVNSYLTILQFKNRSIRKIGYVDLNEN